MATYLGFDPKDTPPYYFVSYNTGDKDTVQLYVTEMDRRGLSLWYDGGLHTGDVWEETISKHLAACEAVIMFISASIFQKEDSFVRKEFNIARKDGKRILVILLGAIDENEIPPKYAFWWSDIKDLQCVVADSFATVGDCVTKVMADLAETPSSYWETETLASTHTTTASEGSLAMLRRRILAAILPLKGSVTVSMLEDKVGYPLSNPDAVMLLKDMVEKGEICNCRDLYWPPSFDHRGRTKDYVGRIIGRADDYVTAKQLLAENQRSAVISSELPALLDTLVKEGTIIKTELGYCSAEYPARLAAAKAFFTDALKEAGGSLPKADFFALTYDGIFARDNARILEDMCEKEQVICHGSLCCLPSFDFTTYVLEKVRSQLGAARRFIPVAKLTVREELDLCEEEFSAVLYTLCAQGVIACRGNVCFFPSFDMDAYIEHEITSQLRTNYTPLSPSAFSVREVLGLSEGELCAVLDGLCDRGQLRKMDGKYCSEGFFHDWQTAYAELLDFIKVNDERLFTKYELAAETKHRVILIDEVLPVLIRDDHLKNSGYYYYAPSRDLMTLLCRHVTKEIEKDGYLSEGTVDGYICDSGYLLYGEEGKKALETVVRECHLFLVPCDRTMNWYYSRPKYYEWLCEQKASAKTAKAFRDLKEKFAALGDFKDSAALAEECGRQAEIFKEKEKAKKLERQKAQEEQKKKNARRRFWRRLFPSFSRKKK